MKFQVGEKVIIGRIISRFIALEATIVNNKPNKFNCLVVRYSWGSESAVHISRINKVKSSLSIDNPNRTFKENINELR